MKKLLCAAILFALAGTVKAERVPLYVHTATLTVAGTGTNSFAFQNTSATRDVLVRNITILPTSSATVISGPITYWVLLSTQMGHGGLTQVSFNAMSAPNITSPSFISASTGPTSILFEGNQASQLPISIIGVNPDETASPIVAVHGSGFDAQNEDQELVLPKGRNRGFVLQQKQYGATDWTAGVVFIRVVYSIR